MVPTMTQSGIEIQEDVQAWVDDDSYKQGFYSNIATDQLAKGINEDVVRAISAKRNEPEWMLEFRLRGVSNLANHGGTALVKSALRPA